ncbi:hypothetical protein HK099_001948, partial [Clydaea vesicula]
MSYSNQNQYQQGYGRPLPPRPDDLQRSNTNTSQHYNPQRHSNSSSNSANYEYQQLGNRFSSSSLQKPFNEAAPTTYGFGNDVPPPPLIKPSRSPPNGADPTLWQWFNEVDLDGSGNINGFELQKALVNGDWTNFELDTVQLLLSTFSSNDKSGAISQTELRSALLAFGYNISDRVCEVVINKFAK